MKMKVIIITYLIFLSFCVIDSARLSSQLTTVTKITNHMKTASAKNITTTSRSYQQSRPTTIIINSTKNLDTNQRHFIATLPTKPMSLTDSAAANNTATAAAANDFHYKNETNETKDNGKNASSRNKKSEKSEYGMKIATTKLSSVPVNALPQDMLKIRQPISTTKPEIPTKTSFSTSTARKNYLPKKYISSTTQKPSSSSSKGPTKIQIPKPKLELSSDALVCPKETEAQFNLFALACKTDKDCTAWNKESRCCTLFNSRNCHKGVPKPMEEQSHKPIFGLIPRKCPTRPLAELFWDLKTCETDDDCWPRVCCPDGQNKYCRTSTPEYESVPLQIGRPLAYFSDYLECTPAPPPIFDIHPKMCNSTLDCLPNVCCQEAGKKICRPPKKSVVSFLANFFNNGLVRRLTNNLVIR